MAIERVTVGVALPINQHRLLRAAARGRQEAAGGRGHASVSRLLSELVERHESELRSYATKNTLSDSEMVSA
jgi:hypothetical protein